MVLQFSSAKKIEHFRAGTDLLSVLLGRGYTPVCVWSGKAVNSKKDNRLPHEAGLKLLKQPVAMREMPVTALIRNPHGIPDWEPFIAESTMKVKNTDQRLPANARRVLAGLTHQPARLEELIHQPGGLEEISRG